MPCRDYFTDDFERHSSYEIRDLKKRTDLLARVACRSLDALAAVDADNPVFKDREVSHWYAAHKAADRTESARQAKEAAKVQKLAEQEAIKAAARKAALKKLTAEEIAAFGLRRK